MSQRRDAPGGLDPGAWHEPLATSAALFERFVGADLTTMWRWLRTAEFDMSTATVREILPEALTVRDRLTRRRVDG